MATRRSTAWSSSRRCPCRARTSEASCWWPRSASTAIAMQAGASGSTCVVSSPLLGGACTPGSPRSSCSTTAQSRSASC
eukprot:7732782-Alexandrium_andersonii.AAC.1